MIPYKPFGRMLDLLILSATDRTAQQELDRLQDQFGWPWKASSEQIAEWNATYSKIDP